MIVIYSTVLLRILIPWFKDISGIAIFPFIILKKEIKGTEESRFTINHERIHIRQQIELFFIIFALCYFLSFIIGRMRGMSGYEAYRNIIFEKEAYANMYDLEYLQKRKFFSFFHFR